MNRINKLYQRYSSFNKPLGNGDTECLICKSNFGLLNVNPIICNSCLKNVCCSCSIDAESISTYKAIWLCKICAEYKEFLKKSGGWFNKLMLFWSATKNEHLPPIVHPQNSDNFLNHSSNNEPLDDSSELNTSTGSNKSNPHHHLENKTTNTLLSNSSTNMNNNNRQSTALNSSIDFDFEHFSEEKLKEDLANSSKLESASFATKTLPKSSTTNFNTNNSDQDSLTDLTMTKSIHDQISASRNIKSTLKPIAPLAPLPIIVNSSEYLTKTGASVLGSIQFSVEYIETSKQLKIHLISAANLPACDSNGLSDPYVKLHLLPGIAKATKLRSKTVYKSLNPKFDEFLQYDGIDSDDLAEKTLRLTVLDEDKFSFDFIGEYRLPLKTIIQNEINKFDVDLEPKKKLDDESDARVRGKINFALKFSRIENCLYVKINRCRQLLPMDNGKSSDPFVQISLLPLSKGNGSKQKFKTSVKWKTLDPEYCEEFKFTNIDMKALLTKSIEISVWDKDFGKCDFIGVVQLSQRRSGDELRHFFSMVRYTDVYTEQWHKLHDYETDGMNETSAM